MLWAVAVATAAVVSGSVVLALASHELGRRGLRAFLFGWIVVPYAVSGLLAWWRRPTSRLGPLMLATAFGMAASALQWSDLPLVHSVGHLLDMLPAALFLHVFLAFPSGRLTTRVERLVVGAGYATALGLQLLKTVLGADPDSVVAFAPRPGVAGMVEAIQLSLMGVLLLTAAVLLARRSRAGRWFRRPTVLVVDAFGVALGMLAVLYVAGLFSWPALDTIRLITFASLGLAPVAFLLALLDARLARGQVAELMIELRDRPTTGLQGALARALRDPSLRLAYWLPEFQSWADEDGEPRRLPEPDEGQVVRVISRGNEPMAALTFHRALEDDPETVDAVAAAASIALENGRLRAELQARLQELRGSRLRVLEAGRSERQRLERNLHDGAQQRLVALSMDLGLLVEDVGTDPELRDRLVGARREVSASLAELRDVARGIYPAVLAGHGLPVALESLLTRVRVPVRLDVDLPERLPEPVEVAAFYVVSETLTNLDKHARATSASVQARRDGSRFLLDIGDDGVGGADPSAGTGLRGLADRVEALGGEVSLSSPPAGGTRLHVVIPCP
jgi:signal transduction histidine kinase